MNTAFGATEHLVPHLHPALAVVGIPVQPRLIGRHRQHHLENGPGAEGGQRPVDQRGIVGLHAAEQIVRVKVRAAYAGQQFAGGGIHHKDTAPRQVQVRDRLAGPLYIGVQGQLHSLGGAGGIGLQGRLGSRHQGPLGRGGAGDRQPVPRPGQDLLIGQFQPGDPDPVPVEIPQQVGGDRDRQCSFGAPVGVDPLRGQILFHLDKERGDAVAVFIQFRLRRKGHIGEKPGIAGIPRDAQRIPARHRPGKGTPGVVVEISPLLRQCRHTGALPSGAGRIQGVGADPVDPAQRHRRQHRKRAAQSRHPTQTHPYRPPAWA